VLWCSSLGDALAFAHLNFSSHGIVFLATLGTMCHLSLGVWTNTLSVYSSVLFVFVCIYNIYALLLFRHNLHHNYGLHVNGVFNLFEHYISLEILVFDSCVGSERLHLFD
jgi:Ca2+/Na+ antiporter